MEVGGVLAIIAVLAAVLTPVVTNYVEQARITRATADTRTIADAVRLYKRDTGYYPIYSSLADARAGTTTAAVLVGPGSAPTMTQTDWSLIGSTTANVVTQLNTALSGLASNDSNPGRASYRGPYIGALEADPWGNRYTVTANNLNSSTYTGFVVSAGPNGTLTTVVAQSPASFAAGGDDIVSTIN